MEKMPLRSAGWLVGVVTAHLLIVLMVVSNVAIAGNTELQQIARRLIAAYPEHLSHVEGGKLIWRDGTRMDLDGKPRRLGSIAWLERPSIADTMRIPYPAGRLSGPPEARLDAGRARNEAFFTKMYGDCRSGEVDRNLVTVIWLPKKSGQRLRVTRINGVAAKLQEISNALDKLPARFNRFLIPAAGAYNCRKIAGSRRISPHAYGFAIDIATRNADYWAWQKVSSDEPPPPYRNRIPAEIVEIFEQHGFIWGGKWSYFDTMHFEYRPELLSPPQRLTCLDDACSRP